MVSLSKIVIPLLLLAFIFAVDANAQKKPRKASTKKTTAKVVPPLDVRAARDKVEIQLENVDLFIRVYGPKADALELLDAAYAKKRVSEAKLAKHAQNKSNIVQTIGNLKMGIATLEAEFRNKTALQKYLPQVEGMTDLVTSAEDLALGNKFVAAKVPLRDVSIRLIDALAVIPK